MLKLLSENSYQLYIYNNVEIGLLNYKHITQANSIHHNTPSKRENKIKI